MGDPLCTKRLAPELLPDERRDAQPLHRVAPLANGSPWPSAASSGSRRDAVSQVPATTDFLTRVLIRTGRRLVVVRLAEVDWIEAAGNYVHLHSGEASHRYRRTLEALELRLDPRCFVRVHRSTIVNVERVAELHPTGSGAYDVVLFDGHRLPLSRSHKKQLFDVLGKE